MPSFLNPSLLWALPLAGLPVLLHLVFLRRARRVPFGDLTLLRAVYLQSRPSSLLRQWLILVLRCLILACAVLAFSRPVLHSSLARDPGAAGPEQGLRLVLLLDVSYSMGAQVRGRTRLESAIASGEILLRMLRPQDRVAFAAFSDRLEGASGSDRIEWAAEPGSAIGALRLQKLGSRPTDFLPGLRAAYALLRRASEGRRVVVVLSDNASHGFRADSGVRLAELVPDYDPSVALLGLKWPRPPDNAAIESVAASEAAGPGAAAVLSLRPFLQGQARPEWNVDLWLRDGRASGRRLKLEPGQGPSVDFPLPPSKEPSFWGQLELRHDALPQDDVHYYSFRIPPRPKVLLAHGGARSMEAGRSGYFLRKLFGEDRSGLFPYELEVADSVRLRSLRLSDYAVVWLVDFSGITQELGTRLGDFVLRGGGLWVVPGRLDGPEAYRALSDLLPARLGESRDSMGSGYGLKVHTSACAQEAGFSGSSWEEFELGNVGIRRSFSLEPSDQAKVCFSDAMGGPLLVYGKAGEGRVLLWGSSLDVEWTNLPVKPVFAAWVDWGMRALTGYSGRMEWRTIPVGASIVRRWGAREAAPASVQIRGPHGTRLSVQVRDRRVEYTAERAGLYFLDIPGPGPVRTEAFAANLDRSSGESDLREYAKLPWRPLAVDAPREDFLRAVYGHEARDWVLFFLLLLLALEVSLANPKGLGPASPSARPSSARRRASVLACLAACLFAGARSAAGQEGDRFLWTQIRYAGTWDPYPEVHADILKYVSQVTSVITDPEKRPLAWKDPQLFSSPFVLLAGKQAPPSLDDEELRRLRDYLVSGGFLWIEDASGSKAGAFDRWVRQAVRLVFPESELTPLGADHVVYRTFFLMRAVGGRVMLSPALEGVDWGGRIAVLYSRNDILGALAKDALGQPLYECVPGGEAQRVNARKLALNIVMYALTGNYKTDAVHQPYLLEKMRQGSP